MSCLICFEQVNDNFKNNCSCKFNCHQECFELFLKNSKFRCPICREKKIIKNNTQTLINLVFKLPAPLSIIVWFIISFFATIFIIPLGLLQLYYEKYYLIFYSLYIYSLVTLFFVIIENK